MQDSKPIVAVRPGSSLAARPRLFAALTAALEVEFRAWTAGEAGAAAAVVEIAEAAAPGAPALLARHGVPALAIAGESGNGSAAERLQLHETAGLDRRLRGLVLSDRVLGPVGVGPADEVLAGVGAGAVWTRSRGRVPMHSVGAALPELAPGEGLYSLLVRRPLAVGALIQFVRELTAPAGWQAPPTRAAIVFDDPNLRWRSYGFIDYRRLVEHADAHGYHAAMAMIPLDAGRAHGPTVSLFARRRDRVSLVFHGNDHVKRELLGVNDRAAALALSAQALRRVTRFERRSGLAVDRVMMPPHGLCSQHVAGALAALGFDALCTIHALPWTESQPADQPLLGWRPAEFVDGCAVVPRMHLTSSAPEIALRAFADQPLVIYGHHDDVADGFEPLAQAAAAVNRLGDVRWMPVGDIVHANHLLRLSGERAEVRPFARRLLLDLPGGVSTIRVDAPVAGAYDGALAGWSVGRGPIRPFGTTAPVDAGGAHEVRLHARAAVDARSVARPSWRPWPRLRRAATEARDRVRPLAAARPRRLPAGQNG